MRGLTLSGSFQRFSSLRVSGRADIFPEVCQPLTAAPSCDVLSYSIVVSNSTASSKILIKLSILLNSTFTELQINVIDLH